MKKQKAISILSDLRQKLNSVTVKTHEVWQTQARSYIGLLFGEASPEFKYIDGFDFIPSLNGGGPEQVDRNKQKMDLFLTNCIETIELKGVKKKEWKHALVTTNPALFWSVFVALLGLVFWAGQLTTHKRDQAPDQHSENENKRVLDRNKVHKSVLEDTAK